MSGFVAIVAADGPPVDDALLGRLTDGMSYCGPDHQATWSDGRAGLGHALLSPSPPASDCERQPATLGRTWIAADARLDGRRELERALRSHGRDVGPATPDAQLILHAYVAWGERCVEQLVGDFAFAVWDADSRRLFCAHDHFGTVPLYYARTRAGIVVGNVLWALRAHPEVSDELDERAIGDILLFRFNMDHGTTVFTDVRRLPPGHALTVDAGDLRVWRYWEPPQDDGDPRVKRRDECVERFTILFDDAVADRLRGDRAGTHLSGGMDSTSVAATAKHVLVQRGGDFELRAYTVVSDRLIAEEEGRYGALAARRIGIPVEQLVFEDYATRAPNGVVDWVFPEPVVVPSQSPEYEISTRTASFARALFAGFGGDPLFQVSPTWPAGLGDWVERGRFGWHRARAGLSPRFGIRAGLRARLGRSDAGDVKVPGWISASFARRVDLRGRLLEIRRDWHAVTGPRSMLHPMWSGIFGLAHPGACGLPCRTLFPFFDVRLAHYVWRTPRYEWRADKLLLRAAMHDRLPTEVLRRAKTPLYAPAAQPRTADPAYRLALLPEARRLRAELLSCDRIRDYVDVARARTLVDSPVPHTDGPLDNCFSLADWLRSMPNPPHVRG